MQATTLLTATVGLALMKLPDPACADPGSLRCACVVVRRSACNLLRNKLLSDDRVPMSTVIPLLDKRGFRHNHLPVLVVRQRHVKSSLLSITWLAYVHVICLQLAPISKRVDAIWFRRFVRGYAKLVGALTNLLRKDVPFVCRLSERL